MAQTSVVKVTSAFVAGIVVALGSALIYVKVSEAPPAARAVLQIPPSSGQAPDKMESIAVAPPAAVAKPAVAEPAAVKPQAASALPPHKHLTTKAVLKTRPKTAPAAHLPAKTLEVAQRGPAPMADTPPVASPVLAHPASVAATPAARTSPARAVNDASILAAPQADLGPGNALSAPAKPPEPHVVTLPSGTTVAIRLGETLSTEHNYSGDTFRATLDAPIVIDGFIIADRGSRVLGQIVNAQQAGRMEGRSNLSLALTEINTTDGQRVQIETGPYGKQGPSNTKDTVAKMAGGAALGAIIGAIGGGGKGAAIGAGVGGAAGTGAVLLTHGKPMVLDAETQLSFQLSKPTVITEKLN